MPEKAFKRSMLWFKIFAGLAVASSFLVSGLVVLDNWRDDQRRDDFNDRICESLTENRDLLDSVIVEAYAPSGSGLDLTAAPAYADLPPETKAWVDQVQGFLSAPAPADPRDADADGIPDAITDLLDEVPC